MAVTDWQDPPVGYGVPPKHSQFKKGQAPPPRRPKPVGTDIYAFLAAPIEVVEKGARKKRQTLDVAFSNLANKAIKGDMRAAARFIKECDRAGLLTHPVAPGQWPMLLRIPHDFDKAAWHENLDKFGPPPWPGEHNGLPRVGDIL